MTKHLILENKKYLPSKDAATSTGYTGDYIGRLCRAGDISCTRIGRAWYVEEESLNNFVLAKRHAREERKKELSDERRNEYETGVAPAPKRVVQKKAVARRRAQKPVASPYRYEKPVRIEHPVTPTLFRQMLAEQAVNSLRVPAHAIAHAAPATANLTHKALALLTSATLVLGTLALADAAYLGTTQRVVATAQRYVDRVAATLPRTVADIEEQFNTAALALDTYAHDPSRAVVLSRQAVAQVGASNFVEWLTTGTRDYARELVATFRNLETPEWTFAISGNARSRVNLTVEPVDLTPTITLATSTPETTATPTTGGVVAAGPTTVVQNPVIERVVETQRIVTQSGITLEDLQQVENELRKEIARASAANTSDIGHNFRSIALTQRIDNLSDVDIANSRITNSSVGATTLSVSSNATIDGNLTVGGTTTFSGTLAAGDLSYTGTLTTPLSAGIVHTNASGELTSATGTANTIAKFNATGVALADSIIADDGSGVTISGGLTVTGTSTLATTTIADLSAQDATITTGAITNLTATSATTTNLVATNATTTNLYSTLLTALTGAFTNFSATNATTTNLFATSSTLVSATTTNLFATNATTTNLVVGNSLTLGGSATLATTTVDGDFTVNGNTTLGDAASDTVTITGLFASSLVPNQNATYDLGSPSYYWDDAYIDSLNVNNISAASTTIGGTANESFTINTDNATADTEDINLIFYRGTVVPNALIAWDSSADRFDINQPFFIQNDSSTTTVPTLQLAGTNSQTAPIFAADDYSGDRLLTLTTDGKLGIGTSTPYGQLHVYGNSLTGPTAQFGNMVIQSLLDGNAIVGNNIAFDGGVKYLKDGYASYFQFSNGNINFTSAPSGTAGGSVSATQNLTVKNTGNVGIGTSSPAYKLDVAGTLRATGIATFDTGISVTGTTTLSSLTGGLLRANASGVLSTTTITGSDVTANSLDFTEFKDSLTLDASTDITVTGSNVFSITNTGTGNSFVVNDEAGDSTAFKITSDGRVGIGGTPAGYDLTIFDPDVDGSAEILLHNGSAQWNISNNSSDTFNITKVGTSGSELVITNTTSDYGNARFDFSHGFLSVNGDEGRVGIGDVTPNAALEIVASSTDPLFALSSTGPNTGDIFIVDGDGDVGIGIESPTESLHIAGSGNQGIRIAASGNESKVTFTNSVDSANGWSIGTFSDGNFSVYDNDGGGTRFTVADDGNVGIGTTTPAAKLQVLGTSEQLRLAYDSDSYSSFTVASSGATTFDGAGLELANTTGNRIRLNQDGASGWSNELALNDGSQEWWIRANSGSFSIRDHTGGTSGVFEIAAGAQADSQIIQADGDVIFNAGNVGIGDTSPLYALTVGNSDLFGVSATGTIAAATGITSSGTITFSDLAGGGVLTTDGSGVLSTTTIGASEVTADSLDFTEFKDALTLDATTTIAMSYPLNFDSSTLYIDPATNRVGIGTTNASQKLTVDGTILSEDTAQAQAFFVGTGRGYFGTLNEYDVEIQTNNANRLRIGGSTGDFSFNSGDVYFANSTGNVGIGTTSPAAKLQLNATAGDLLRLAYDELSYWTDTVAIDGGRTIAGFGTDADLNIDFSGATDGDFSVNSNDLFVDTSAGYVGIGTNAPGADLQIVRTGTAVTPAGGTALAVQNTGTSNANAAFNLIGGNAGGSNIFFGDTDNTNIGRIAYSHTDNSLTLYTNSAQQLVVDSSGNVGIGTTSPSQKLHVVSGTSNQVALFESTDANAYIGFADDSTVLAPFVGAVGSDISFWTNTNRRLTITSAGNVGIGDTSPLYALTVGNSDLFGVSATGTIAAATGITSSGTITFSDLAGGILTTDSSGVLSTTTLGAASITADSLDFTEFKDALTLDASTDIAVTGSNVFSITNTGTGNSFVVRDEGSDSTPFVIDAAGNVDIGTNGEALTIGSDTHQNNYIRLRDDADYGATIGYANGTPNGLLLQSGLAKGITFAVNSGTFNSGATTAMRIDENGNVGVGTTSPSADLEVYRSSGTTNFRVSRGAEYFEIYHDGSPHLASTDGFFYIDDNINLLGASDIQSVDQISVVGSGVSYFQNGKVGFGTTTPASKVHVLSTTEQLRLAYDGVSYWTDTIASDGGRTLAGFGTDADLNIDFSNATDGDFSINGNDFFVDTSANRVGIGTASPTTGLDVNVATDISGDLTISGGASLTYSATGPITQTGTGQVTLGGNLDAQKGVDVTGGNLTVGGSNFTVAYGSGNTSAAGTLHVQGAITASSTLNVDGAAVFDSTAQVNDTLTAAGSGTGLSVTNNASVGGTLGVTGATTLSSTLNVSGTLTANAANFSGAVSVGSNKITSLANPTNAQDAATKTYVDSVAQGLDLKDSVRVVTTTNIALSGEQTIDGIAVSGGDRVLVKDQTDPTENGIYVASTSAWSRAADADADSEVNSGLFAFVEEGTENANSGWVLTTADPITVDSTSLSFTQFSGAGQIVAGTGITKSGNVLNVVGTADRITANEDSIDIADTYVGQSSITTVGDLSSGSITSGFGAIDIGTSPLTAGEATFSAIVGSAITGSGNLTINGEGTFTDNVSVSGTLSAATTTLSGNLVMNNNRITGLADPTSAQEAATKAYVDAIAQGLSVKASVRVATEANITLSGTQTIDSVSLDVGDRVLVKNQTDETENGIYVVASSTWSRATDADENSEVVTGMYTFIEEGTNQSNTGWSMITAGTITLESSSLVFTQFSGSAETVAGDGLTKSGNTFNVGGTADRITVNADTIDIASTYVGQNSITTVGALSQGSITSTFGNINIGSSTLTAALGTLSNEGATTNSITNLLTLSSLSSGTTTAAGIGAGILFKAEDDGGTAANAGRLSSILTNVGSTTQASAFTFETRTGGGALAEVLRIDASGNVGIGDTSADNRLDISSSGEAALALTSLGANTDALIKFELTDNTPTFVMGVDDSDLDKFKISTTALGTDDRFTIDASGQVGIGDSSPAYLLSVGAGDLFGVNSSGAIAKATGITSSGAITFEDLVGGILRTDGSGVLSTTTVGASDITADSLDFTEFKDTLTLDATTTIAASYPLNFDSNTLYIDPTNNRVGVGTASPSTALHVGGTVTSGGEGSLGKISLLNTTGTERGVFEYDGTIIKAGASSAGLFDFALYAGGDEKARITSTGNVGIGTTTPAAKLQVLGTSEQLRLAYNTTSYWTDTIASDGGRGIAGFGSDADLNLDFSGATDGDFSINTSDFFVDTSAGSVAIGTTSPDGKLTIEKTIDAAQELLTLRDYNGVTKAAFEITTDENPNLTLGTSGLSAGTYPLIVGDSTFTNQAAFVRADNVGTFIKAPSSLPQIEFNRAGSQQFAFGIDGSNNFVISDNSTIGTNDRFAIDSSGNIGIGTTTPGAKLHVSDGELLVSNSTAGAQLTIDRVGTNSHRFLVTGNNLVMEPETTEGDVLFNDFGNTLTMQLDHSENSIYIPNGNIGIGTSTPSARLTANAGTVDLVALFESSDDTARIRLKDHDTTAQISVNAADGLSLGFQGSANILNISSAGNVGIGDTSPLYALTVGDGDLFGVSATGTIAAATGITSSGTITFSDLAGGILTTDSSGVLSTTTLGAASITADSLDFTEFKDALTLDATTTIAMSYPLNFDSNTLYIDPTNNRVGIGTASPTESLHVSGSGNQSIKISAAGSEAKLSFTNAVDPNGWAIGTYGNGSFSIFDADGGGTRVTFADDGNVGIGTTTPAAKLQVLGTSEQFRLGYSTDSYWTDTIISNGDRTLAGFGTDADLNIDFSGATDGDFSVNGSDLFVDTSTGRVGVGDATPEFELDVVGDIAASDQLLINSSTQTISGTSLVDIIAGSGSGNAGAVFNVAASTGVSRIAFAVNSVATDGAGIEWDTATGKLSFGGTFNRDDLTIDHTTGDVAITNNLSVGTSSASTNFEVYDATTDGLAILRSGDLNASFDLVDNSGTVRFYNSAGKLRLQSDPDNESADSRISFEVDGSEKARIDNNGYFGIGTTTPAAKLQVLGTNEQLRLAYDTTNYWTDTIASDSGRTIAGFGTDADLNIDFSGATDGDFSVNGSDLFVDTSTGFVGVGTTTPGATLNVAGSFKISGNVGNVTVPGDGNALDFSRPGANYIRATDSLGYLVLSSRGSTALELNNQVVFYKNLRLNDQWISNDGDNEGIRIDNSGNVGIGETSPGSRLSVSGGATIGTSYDTTAAPTNGLLVEGNVGIGTTSPDNVLTVHGGVNISDTDYGYKIGNATVLYASTTNNSVSVGQNAGGLLTSTGSYNTAVGLDALATATSSDYNTALGYRALRLTVADLNTAVGAFTLSANTTGTSNTAVGEGALPLNTSGSYNTALGLGTLQALTTGSYNTVLGYNSGGGIATGTKNTIIGANVSGLSGGLSNNIILADGDGNQRIRIDSSGNVGIGTTSPSEKLDVAGNVLLDNNASIKFRKSDTGSRPVLALTDSDRVRFYSGWSAANGSQGFEFVNANSSATLLRILNDGNVGIGTTTPDNVLTVHGDINISDIGSGYKIGNETVLYASSTLFSTVVGYNAGASLTTGGQSNTAVGYEALASTTTSDANTALGYRSLSASNTGGDNTAVGYLALTSNTSGNSNTAVGRDALYANLGGDLNTAIGENALDSNTDGDSNVAVGFSSLDYNTTGSNNVGIGNYSLSRNTTGTFNFAAASGALLYNTTGSWNAAIGVDALRNNDTGSYNVALGGQAGYDIDNASSTGNNTFIGYNTGRGIITGTGNTILGANVTGLATTTTNNIILADGSGNQRIRIDSSGNVGIGTTTPSQKLHIQGNARLTGALYDATNSAGTSGYILQTTGSGTQWVATSSLGISSGIWTQNGSDAYYTTGSVGIGTTTPASKLHVYGGNAIIDTTSGTPITVQEGGVDRFAFNYNFTDNIFALQTANASSTLRNRIFADAEIEQTRITVTDQGTATGSLLDLLRLNYANAGNDDGSAVGLFFDGSGVNDRAKAGIAFERISGNARGNLHFLTDDTADGSDVTLDDARMTITSAGNIGIGTTTPSQKLSVVGNVDVDGKIISDFTGTEIPGNGNIMLYRGTGTGAGFRVGSAGNLAIDIYDGSSDYNQVLSITQDQNVGIGVTDPDKRLEVFETVADAQLKVSYDATRYANFQVDSVGDLIIDPQGDDLFLNDDNAWICTGGACPSGTPTGTGNLIVENKIGLGTTSPDAKLTIETQDSSTNFLRIASSTAEILAVNANGNVGIGTSTPFAKFTVGADGAIATVEKALSDSATISVNWLQGNQQRVVLGGNRTINFSNYIAGQTLRLVVCQDGTGSRTVTWDSNVTWSGGTAPTLTTGANKCDVMTFLATNATSTLKVFGSAVLDF